MVAKKKQKKKVKKVKRTASRSQVHPHLARMLNHYAILNRPRDDSLNSLLYAERRSEHHLQQAFREQDQRIKQEHFKVHETMRKVGLKARERNNEVAKDLDRTKAAMDQGLRAQQAAFETDINDAFLKTVNYMSDEVERLEHRSHQRASDQENINAQTTALETRSGLTPTIEGISVVSGLTRPVTTLNSSQRMKTRASPRDITATFAK